VTSAIPSPPRIAIRALVALVAALAVVATLAGEARAARGMELAVQDDAVLVSKGYFKNTDKAYAHLRALGTTRIRVNVLWAYTMGKSQYNARKKPAGLNYNFSIYDRTIDEAADAGIRVHASLTGPAPRWATGDRKKVSGFKPSASEYGKFAAAAAAHFKGRVDRYSVWNEPNWKTWLGPVASQASLYRGLYTRGYAAIKKADPKAKVLIAETSPYARPGLAQSPIAFLRALTCVNAKYKKTRSCPSLKTDGYAHHPYDFNHAPNFQGRNPDDVTMGTLSRLTRALDKISRTGRLRQNGGGRIPLYLTEFGYFSSGHRAVKKSLRVKWFKQAYSIALANGRVKSQLQYLLVAPPTRSSSAFFNTALLTTRGKKYPTYNALQGWYRSHRGSVKRPGGAITLPPAPGTVTEPPVVPPTEPTPLPAAN
jgi:hypothetical protein